jgi:hypothetical protein
VVEHQLGTQRLDRSEQLVQLHASRERVGEVPAVPEDRERTHRLEVADLEPTSEQPHVSLDQPGTEVRRVAELLQVVACTMRHDESAEARERGSSRHHGHLTGDVEPRP